MRPTEGQAAMAQLYFPPERIYSSVISDFDLRVCALRLRGSLVPRPSPSTRNLQECVSVWSDLDSVELYIAYSRESNGNIYDSYSPALRWGRIFLITLCFAFHEMVPHCLAMG